jgi:hypothetical protein
MDVELDNTSEPADGTQAVTQMPEERHGDCGNLNLANQLLRIRDHRASACQNPNTTKAVLGGMFSNLAEFEARLGHSALEVLRGASAAKDSGLTMQVIDLIIRLNKQIAKIVELDTRLSSSKSWPQPE